MTLSLSSTARGAALLLALSAAPAFATGNFPPVIRQELQLGTTPDCALCHGNVAPGPGTVTTPFGRAMRQRGLQPYDETSLRNALAQLRDQSVDSDADGASDIDELKAGKDPNVAAAPGGGGGEPEPTTGCGGEATGAGMALVHLAGLSGLVALRRRSRR